MTGINETRICYKCDYETNNPLGACPQCGHHLRTTAQIKRLGMMMVALGGFLILFMGGITVTVAQMVWHPFNPHASSRFTGGSEALVFIFGIFAVVMMFGLTSLAAGIFQIKYGRRNRNLVKIILVLACAFIAAGILVQIFL